MNKKKRVVILNYGLHISGVSKALINFANSLAQHGYDIAIKLAVNDFTLADELDPRVKTSVLLCGVGKGRIYGKLMQLIEKLPVKWQWLFTVGYKYDVEIAFNRGLAAKLISASCNKESKKLVWVHNDYMLSNNALAGFKDERDAFRGYSKFTHVICVSEQSRKSFCKRFGDTGNLVVCYNVLDTESIIKKAHEAVIPKSNFTIVSVGRLSEQKNYSLLIDTADELNKRNLRPTFWVVGDGELRQVLLDYNREKGTDNVHFIGAKKNPYPYFNAADLYLCTSTYEGLSTTTIEALILNKPIVVTDCTGMKDILGENQWGLVVPINCKDVADAIERMMTDESFRRDYTKKSIERSKNFSTEELFKGIEKYL